jgi:hypothetical protein
VLLEERLLAEFAARMHAEAADKLAELEENTPLPGNRSAVLFRQCRFGPLRLANERHTGITPARSPTSRLAQAWISSFRSQNARGAAFFSCGNWGRSLHVPS